jgi:hypothetical protein
VKRQGFKSGIEEEEVTGARLLACLTRGRRRPRADEGVPPVSDREGGRDTVSVNGFLGCGLFFFSGPRGSPRPFSIFFCFLPFPFLVSLIFCIFCKNASKPLKPLSEIF